jgi:hypothetical protein
MRSKVVALFGGLCLCAVGGRAAEPAEGGWQFAVAGDSRNCGDVVMPAIARNVAAQRDVAFYWHLGDFRLMGSSDKPAEAIDEDMQAEYGATLTVEDYRQIAWGDFIANQVAPFGRLPVFLGIGNHELYKSVDKALTAQQNVAKSRADFMAQFAYWLDRPQLRRSRTGDGAGSGPKTYYHWAHRQVDFIYLDNADDEGFDATQAKWLSGVLEKDKSNDEIRSIVVGMHRALPNSWACGHSMNGDKGQENAAGIASGRKAYKQLATWRRDTGKAVYVLASHSHFVMKDIFRTPYWSKRDAVLPGWIVGTAGAKRYSLPEALPPDVLGKTYVYGYLLATVAADGTIGFEFEDVKQSDVPGEVVTRYGTDFVDFCFMANRDPKPHPPPDSCNEK